MIANQYRIDRVISSPDNDFFKLKSIEFLVYNRLIWAALIIILEILHIKTKTVSLKN